MAQLQLSDTLTVPDLVRSLIGEGVEVSNINITCDTVLAIRQFEDNGAGLNLNQGLLMSTGLATEAQGPNLFFNQSTNLFQPGYAPLTALAGQPTFDACLIEFDVVPYCDSLGIRYVFASEEYSEYVNSFNDAFAFYISGPGIAAPAPGQNLALVPGTPTPVSINTINNGFAPAGIPPNGPCTNCPYFVDNTNGLNLEFDGYTVPLLAQTAVQPCQTYHLTLAIADANDQFYDSGVFLQAQGIGCLTPQLSISASNGLGLDSTVLVESCLDTGYVTFSLAQPVADTTYFALTLGGTATSGADYQPLPDTVVFLPGQSSITWPVIIWPDALTEGVETLVIGYQGTVACSGVAYADSAFFEIREQPFVVTPLPDTLLLCYGTSTPLSLPAQPGWTYQWDDTTGIDAASTAQPIFSLSPTGNQPDTLTYVLTISALPDHCDWRDTLTVIAQPPLTPALNLPSACAGQASPYSLTPLADSSLTYAWDMGDGSHYGGISFWHSYDSAGQYLIQLTATDLHGCQDTTLASTLVGNTPDASFEQEAVCAQTEVALSSLNPGPDETHLWDFGDGQSSTQVSPTHAYDSAGNYLIIHLAANPNGCADTATLLLTVYPRPTADFTADRVCQGDTALLVDASTSATAPIISYQWTWGTGNSSGGATYQPVFPTGGQVPVGLRITDSLGCQDSLTRPVAVFPRPTAALVADSGCAGSPLTFADQSLPGQAALTQWQWKGPGLLDSGQVITHSFDSVGTLPVQLIVVDSAGCRDTALATSEVYPRPVAAFEGDSLCHGQLLNVQPDSVNPAWSHQWRWGDGDSSLQPMGTHRYAQPGSYLVQQVVQSPEGCADTAEQVIEVYASPQADFEASAGCLGTPTAFTNLSLGTDWPIVQHQWSLGPAGSSLATNPVITFAQAGLRPVRLITIDQFGCRDTLTRSAQVYAPPQARFEADSGCVSGPLTFSDRTRPGDAPLTQWSWDLGDGRTQSLPQFEHLYDSVGTFPVQLIVADSLGCTDTVQRPIWIFPLPEVSFTSDPACDGTPVQFISGPQGSGASYRWNFGDGETSSLPNPQRTFAGPGIYRVWLVVSTAVGCADSVEGAVQVYRNPQPSFRTEPACEGEEISFRNLTLPGDHPVRNYRWRLGDGSQSAQPSPQHRYEGHGQWSVRLQAIDTLGCRADTTLSVRVWAKPDLDFLPDTACAGTPVHLQDLSSLPDASIITRRQWTLSGNRRYLGNQPVVSFPVAGPYFIELKVTTDQGCTDSLRREALVYPAPQLDFTFDSACAGVPTPFQATIAVDTSQFLDFVSSWRWQLGDSAEAGATLSPVHLYPRAGRYAVTLSAVTNRGCTNELTQEVPVWRTPAAPRVRDTTVCTGSQALLLAASWRRSDELYWYQSPTGNVAFEQGSGYLTSPLLAGQSFWVESRTENGCSSPRQEVQARIHPDAEVRLLPHPSQVERPEAVVPFALDSRLPLLNHEWDFGDGSQSTEAAPMHRYTLAGVFPVEVWVQDVNRCWYGLRSQVEVKEQIHLLVPSAFSPNGDGVNETFYLATRNMQALSFEVFNRWGQRVFFSDELGFQWDGTHQGQRLPAGVYVYRLESIDLDGREWSQSGTITLLR